MKKAEINRGRHGRFDLFVENNNGEMILRRQYDSAIEAENDARDSCGAEIKRERGRPMMGDEPQKRRNVSLSNAHAEKARMIGDGNISLGIRIALDAYAS